MASSLILIVVLFAVTWFLLIRPHRKRQIVQRDMLQKLAVGDEVVTAGGIIGEVVHVREATAGTVGMEDRVTIKSGEARLVVERGRIARVLSAGAGASGPAAS